MATRYIVKKFIYKTEKVLQEDNYSYNSDSGYYTTEIDVVNDIQILGIFKTRESAETYVEKLSKNWIQIDEIEYEE